MRLPRNVMDDLLSLFEWLVSRAAGKLLRLGLLALPLIVVLGWFGIFSRPPKD